MGASGKLLAVSKSEPDESGADGAATCDGAGAWAGKLAASLEGGSECDPDVSGSWGTAQHAENEAEYLSTFTHCSLRNRKLMHMRGQTGTLWYHAARALVPVCRNARASGRVAPEKQQERHGEQAHQGTRRCRRHFTGCAWASSRTYGHRLQRASASSRNAFSSAAGAW